LPGARRRERRAQLSRGEILQAALELARERGWERVTMRAIAERVEASPAYAYRYFASREAILLALVRDGFARLLAAMRAAAGEAPNPARALRQAKHAYVRFALEERELYQAMYGLAGVGVPAELTWEEGAALGELDARLLAEISGRPPKEHEDDVLVLWAAVHGLVALSDGGRVAQPLDQPGGPVDRVIDDALARARVAAGR
jgi:AcrR family transcriptional regulator